MLIAEKSVSSNRIFEGKVINVRVDTIETQGGNHATREIIEHPGGVAVVPLTDDNEVLVIKQYRRPYDDFILEIPAGKLEKGEDHFLCGIRELKEETGCTAENYEYLGCIYVSPGFCNEVLYLYLAEGLNFGGQDLDEDEYVEVLKVPLQTLVEKCVKGEIKDAKTVTGILKTNELLKCRMQNAECKM